MTGNNYDLQEAYNLCTSFIILSFHLIIVKSPNSLPASKVLIQAGLSPHTIPSPIPSSS